MSIILKSALLNDILIYPAKTHSKLLIISGFATPAMATHHIEAIQDGNPSLDISLIVGMTPLVGISKNHHNNFVKFTNNNSNFICSYIGATQTPIHSKLYIWLRDNKPSLAYLTSANYTLTAFKQRQDEIACICDPMEAFNYYNSVLPLSIYCTCDEANDLAVDRVVSFNPLEEDDNLIKESVLLPLFSERDEKVQEQSGLNWGQRRGREPNQAYISIPSRIARTRFFPPRGEQFSVLTDDGFPFVCVVAQDNDKAIHTTNNNSEFGEYFRNKLGVPLGEPVVLADLDRYGNRYVKFTKINEEEYYMEYLPK